MTDKVLILASAHHPDPNAWAALRDTCALFGAPLKVIGMDKPMDYASNDPRLFLESVPETLAFLESSDAEYVVLTDAFNVLCCRWDAAELIEAIDAAKGELIVSCEANCFPDGPWRGHYDALSTSPWRYGNAGQLCGTHESVLRFYRALTAGVRKITGPYDPCGRAAQQVLHRLFCGGYPMALDSQCEIFQSMYTDAAEHVEWKYGVNNHYTEPHPFFLHFNGRPPVLSAWYHELTGKVMPLNPMRPEYGKLS